MSRLSLDLPEKVAEPVRHPVMVQRWTDVVFLHWRADPSSVERLLPAGLDVDVFDHSAWVGLVPFQMSGLGFPGLSPLPVVGSFPEVNVRTYVRSRRRRGVWFFSLDVDRWTPALTARVAYKLPYCVGAVQHRRVGDVVTSSVRRSWPRAQAGSTSAVSVRIGMPVDPDDAFVRFVTCRWGLLSAGRRGAIRYAPVDHPTWPLHHADVLTVDDHLADIAGLPEPDGVPHALWSPGVAVRVGRPQRSQ